MDGVLIMKLITVLMTTYNESDNIISKAMDSVLLQSFKDFDFLIIVDNPKNYHLINILQQYSAKDERIKVLINKKNIGLPLSLNKGIDLIETKYIARMDADDLSDPCRLEKQLFIMENNPKIAMLGSNIIYMDNDEITFKKRGSIPLDNKSIKTVMKCMNVLNHPTFFGKTEIFKKYKYRNLKYSQDYDFVCRLLENNECVINMPDYLLKYRVAETKSNEKIIKQKLIYYYIQSLYKKNLLSTSNIVNGINDCFEKVDKQKFLEEINSYNLACDLLKQKKYIKGVAKFIDLYIHSEYINIEINNLINYMFLKCIYNF